jgi:hypothetical protein
MSENITLERQRNAIQFAILFIKSILALSSGAIIALLAFIATAHVYDIRLVYCLGGYFLSTFLSLSGVYCGYWSELHAHNQAYSASTTEHDKLQKSLERWFAAGHILALLATIAFFVSGIFTSWVLYCNLAQLGAH